MNSANLNNLHILRGITALYVVVYHSKFVLWCGGKEYLNKFPMKTWTFLDYGLFGMDIFSSAGYEVVLIFFVLSGFFIAQSFNKNNWSIGEFYLNRITRIYPPYIFSLLMAALVLVLINLINPSLFSLDFPFERNQRLQVAYESLSFSSFGYALLYTPTREYLGMNIVYWSLLVEAIFYIIAPFVVKRPFSFSFFSLIGFFLFKDTKLDFFHFPAGYSIYFSLGVLIFHFKNAPIIKSLTKHYWLSIGIILVLLFVVVACSVLKIRYFIDLSVLLFSFFSIIFLINHKLPENFLTNMMMNLGRFSYSLYLLHFPILLLVYSIFTRLTGNYNFYSRIYWISIPVAVIMSYGLYLLVEKKNLKIIDSMRKKRDLRAKQVILER